MPISSLPLRVTGRVPGFTLYKNFLPRVEYEKVVRLTGLLMQKITSAPRDNPKKYKTSLYPGHRGLLYDVPIEDEDGQVITFRHFGEFTRNEKHGLYHFKNKQNIPKFLRESLVTKVIELPEVKALGLSDYNVSVNRYGEEADFPYHQDTAKNNLTIVYSVRPKELDFVESEVSFRRLGDSEPLEIITVPDNSVYLLSDYAYNDCEHQVRNHGKRISFAFGRLRP